MMTRRSQKLFVCLLFAVMLAVAPRTVQLDVALALLQLGAISVLLAGLAGLV
jgi:hypothetical protein